MMGNYYPGMMGGGVGWWSFFGIFTWITLVIFLILGSIYFWKEINKKERR